MYDKTPDSHFKDEEWKDLDLKKSEKIHYQISNHGRIRSFAYDPKKGRVLKGGVIQGYKTSSIKKERFKKNNGSIYVHKLVAMYFLEKEDKIQEYVIHLDYNKLNNHVNNLKWVTKDEKEAHFLQNPNYLAQKGSIKNAKLTENDVLKIKKRLKKGNVRLKLLANEFGITHTQLNRIRRGENWGHVKLPEDK